MKRISFIFSSILITFLFSACGPTIQDAADYNENVIADQLLVINKFNTLDSAFLTYSPEKIEPAMKKAKSQVLIAISNLEKLGVLNEDSTFYNSTMELYKLFENQLNNEYAEQLKIYKLSDDDYTEKKRERYNELMNKINNDYAVVNQKFMSAQKSFASHWGLELEEK